MKRKNKIITFLIIGILIMFQACNQIEIETQKPNVILILIDDYGYADISREGNTQIKTPGMDKIANEGMRFTNFYQSAAACAPTRASLLTGRYHLRTGVWGVHWGRDFISNDETTFADLAKDAGYVTGAFGKWHSGKSVGYHSWDRGFDVGLESNLYHYFNTNVLVNNKLVNIEGPITNVITDNAIKFIEENRDTSFLCYIPYQSIHEPFNCPDKVFQEYKKQGYSDHVARLYGMIQVLDENISRLMDKINKLDLDDNTLIMFIVDDGSSPGFDLSYSGRRMNPEEKQERINGWAKELRGTKANIYEGGVKSPCYIRWKGKINPDTQVDALSGVIDVLPTLAEICEFDIPENHPSLDGKSLAPILFGEKNSFDDRFYFDNTNLYRISKDRINMEKPEIREMSVRHNHFKMVRLNHKLNGREGIDYLLFDLSKDEKEENNIINQYPEVSIMLKDTLSGWFNAMVNSKNAFTTSTYNVGSWNERSTFINLDAIVTKTGNLKRDNGPGFNFTNWDTPGNSLSYNINVLEAGDYQAEIFIKANDKDLGGELEVFTEHSNAIIKINDTKKVKSGILHLPAGKQTFTVRLKSTRESPHAMQWMNNIILHRIPLTENDDIIQKPGMKVYVPSSNQELIAGVSNAPFEFCANNGTYGKTMNAKVNQEIELTFLAANPEQIASIELFIDFGTEYTSNTFQPNHQLKFDVPGLYTLNAVYTSKSGFKCGSQVNIKIE